MNTTIAAPQAVLTIYEAAEYLRVSTRTLYAITKPRGPIPSVRVGSRGVRYTWAALQKFIDQQQNGNSSPTSCCAPGAEHETNGKTA